MARIQDVMNTPAPLLSSELVIRNVRLHDTEESTKARHVHVKNKVLRESNDIEASSTSTSIIDGYGGLMAPSLCHPHIHLDKPFLLQHPKYCHLQIEKGDFQEAMSLTGQAKALFDHDDLIERGQRLIDESVAAGVTHMRAFVELDAGVRTKCLDAGVTLRRQSAHVCHVQLCAFAQLPLFSSTPGDEDGGVIRTLMRQAAINADVEVVGSTPYVESDRELMKANVGWMVDLSIEHNLHLDFHLDYNLDAEIEPLVWHVVETLVSKDWKGRTHSRTIVLGHCTRLTLFTASEWARLASLIQKAELPISFVGLPTSDLFMMRTHQQPEIRGTLNIPQLIKTQHLNACIGINNIGNAFTPQGSCDPLGLACHGVGVYQAGTKQDAELLYECVSTRARAAIGLARPGRKLDDFSTTFQENDHADFVIFGGSDQALGGWRSRKTISEIVYLYDCCQGRMVMYDGKVTRGSTT